MKKVFMFPGQGSQKVGMGSAQFDKYPDLVSQAGEILGYDIKELCLSDAQGQLGNTAFTQPALFTVCTLMFKERKDAGEKADALIGHSLGEYTALYAAGAFDFSTGLKLVQKRGEIMAKAHGGGMAAVIGMDDEEVKEVLESSERGQKIDVANFNAPGQVVVSGAKDDILAMEDIFTEAGAKRYLPLNVSGAFHSRYMKEAALEFSRFLNGITFNNPEITVIANVNAKTYTAGSVKDNLVAQIHNSVRWADSVKSLLDQDAQTEFTEVGPGIVLTGLLKRIKNLSAVKN